MNRKAKPIYQFRETLEKKATKSELRFRDFLNHIRVPYEFQKVVVGQSGKQYIADFYLPRWDSIIEVDGDFHWKNDEQYLKDRQRTFDLEAVGYKVLRVQNRDASKFTFPELHALINRKYANYCPSVYYNPIVRIPKTSSGSK